jgi:transposase
MARLTKEEIVTIKVLHEKGESNCAVARRLGVSEGAIRHHLKKAAEGRKDGRTKVCRIELEGLAEAADAWWLTVIEEGSDGRPPSVGALLAYLQETHGYRGSYQSVRRYIRRKFGAPKRWPYRRIETPPGAQSQSDWAQRNIDIGDGPQRLYAFVMVLSHSRRCAIVWSLRDDQVSWHHVHNAAYRRLQGVAAVNRIDNLKTGVSRSAGPWGEINKSYRAYARQLRFHVDPHQPYQPQQKGKAERHVQVLDHLGLDKRHFDSLADLQTWTDQQLNERDQMRICPATGRSVYESWRDEIPFLTPLPQTLPEPFDLVKTCKVYGDCTIRFEGRTYAVPFAYAWKTVEVYGCASEVRILHPDTGDLLVRYPRHTQERILLAAGCYEGDSTPDRIRPLPLGRMGKKLQEIAQMPVERRPVDLYAALAEVAHG